MLHTNLLQDIYRHFQPHLQSYIRMKTFHLIGQNIRTSLSPLIHNKLFQMKGLSNSSYSSYSKQNHFLNLQDLQKQNIQGISITIPFKQNYKGDICSGRLKLGQTKNIDNLETNLSTADEILSRRHIINTIVKNKEKQFEAFNTDIFGVRQCFKQNKQFFSIIQQKNKQKPTDFTAIVIGGGATSEVFMAYFQEMNIRMEVMNRNVSKIEELKREFYMNIDKVHSLNGNVLGNCFTPRNYSQSYNTLSKNLIIINTLPTSIFRGYFFSQKSKQNSNLKSLGQDISSQFTLPETIFHMDVNYRDSFNSLQQMIKQFFCNSTTNNKKPSLKLNKISTGLDMLIWQALRQNELFCGTKQNHAQASNNQHFQQVLSVINSRQKVL